LLISQSAEILGYERAVVENRLLSALLRSDQMHAAVRLAQKSFREENSGGKLAIVRAASGDALEAKRLALQALEAENSSAGEFYENDDVGHVFLGESFRELHEKFPVDASFDAAPVLAVFLFAEAPRLKLSDIESVIEQLDVDVATAIKPLEASHKGVSNAYALRVGDATIFLATGQGRFDDNWQLDSGDAALVSKFDASNGWLAVGSAAWSELRRKPVQKIARRLSGQLARDQATAICVAGEEQWMDFSIFLATDELLSSWQATGNLAAFRDQGATLAAEQPNEVASRRAFMQAVRDHVRDFESTPGSRLEVVADVKEKLQIDPLRVDVTRVRRVYGNLEFDGVLKGNSVLISELRAGLPVTLHADRVRAIQIDDEPVVRRP
jgi:hypothetical protein